MTDGKPSKTSKAKMSSGKRELTPLLSIIIVNFDVKEFIEQLLISLDKALQSIPSEVIVIDNASSDGSQNVIKAKFPQVKLIENEENLGFAKATNQGLRLARGKYQVLINPDSLVQEDTFQRLLGFLKENPDTGMVGCKILNPDGTLQLACRRSFPTPWVSLTKLSGLSYFFPKSRLFGKYNLTYLDPKQSYEVEAISGSFMMVRKAAVDEVGLLDEAFFMYGEDLDWCFRFREAGWKVSYCAETQIIHFKGESSQRAQFDSLKMFYQSMTLFVKKHFHRKYLFMPHWLLLVAIWFRGALAFGLKLVATTAVTVPLIDTSLLILSLLLGVLLRFGSLNYLGSFIPVILGYSVVWMLMLIMFGCYSRHKFSVSRAGVAILAGFIFNTSLTFFLQEYAFSRAVVLLGGTFCLISVSGWRLLAKLLQSLGLMPFTGTLGKTLLARRTLIVGDIDSAERLIRRLNSNIDSGYQITGFVSTNGEQTGQRIQGIEVLGGLPDLNSIIRRNNAHEVIFSTHQLSYDQILGIISTSQKPRVNFKLIPSNLDVIIGKASIDHLDDVPLLELNYKLHQLRHRLVKRTFDLTLGTLLAIFLIPYYVFMRYVKAARCNKEKVVGQHKKEFVLETFINGRFKQAPFIWPLLRGDLSWVGREFGQVAPPELKPGITGLAQINNKNVLEEDERMRYHLYYLKNYSPALDIEILFKALFKI